LLERWEESAEEGSPDVEDSELSRLIAERYAIEQQILVTRGKLVEDDDVEGDQIDERDTFPES
jgi:hypothetical protein